MSGPAELWQDAGRALLAKAIAELAYEEILRPQADAGGHRVELSDGVAYRFLARRGPFGAWRVDASSIARLAAGAAAPADDPLRFVLDARHALGLAGPELADVIRELAATHAADAHLLRRRPTAAGLADLPYVELEAHGTGHPCMILNKGRLGFAASDVARYAPEAGRPLRLRWLAAHPDLARHHGIGCDALTQRQLDAPVRAAFAAKLRRHAADSSGWAWLPVHPFHWDEAIAPLFAAQLAQGRMIVLGEAPDRHRALQSVRTLANVDRPDRLDVKLPLLIRNTLVWRGLAAAPSAAAPQISAWLQDIARRDAFLSGRCRMVVLGEVASVTGRHPQLTVVPDTPYRFGELLGAVWRQPVSAVLEPGERARTMAALNAVGCDGRALVTELVARSGLDPEAWLARFLDVLLSPLLHWLHRYGVAFCPHGENTIVLFDAAEMPVGIAIKDLAEDVNLLPEALPEYASLPADADAVLHRWPARDLRHSILSAVFAGHFRFFGEIVERHLAVSEERFWELVGATVRGYRDAFPELADRIAAFDLEAPHFERICLNREQLLGDGFHDRAERDEGFDLAHGTVANPLAPARC